VKVLEAPESVPVGAVTVAGAGASAVKVAVVERNSDGNSVERVA
jgi:hypothetical protein